MTAAEEMELHSILAERRHATALFACAALVAVAAVLALLVAIAVAN